MPETFITSEDYADFLVANTPDDILTQLLIDEGIPFFTINPQYTLTGYPLSGLSDNLLSAALYRTIPKLYIPQSTAALENTGILNVRNRPALGMTGKDVLIGIIDSGIAYTHPAFRRTDGRTRILALWDQTLSSEPSENGSLPPVLYGNLFTENDINEAIFSENPALLVPSADHTGHGTAVAGIAAGSTDLTSDFSGVAPDAWLAVVKLKEAKNYLKQFFLLSPSVPVYQESDILFAIAWLQALALRLKLPLSICLSVQTWQGAHSGDTALERTMTFLSGSPGITLSTGTGNEADKAHHGTGVFQKERQQTAELLVPENTDGFTAEIWGPPVSLLTIGIQAPSGDLVENIPARLGTSETLNFLLDRTTIQVSYEILSGEAGNQLILLRFFTPSAGIWRLTIRAAGNAESYFHIWLPAANTLQKDIRLLSPDPFTTVMGPGNAVSAITAAVNNAGNTAVESYSGRGYTFQNLITPTIAAPGNALTAPSYIEGYRPFSGASASAAISAGTSAMLLEWGLSRTPPRIFRQSEIRTLLLRGSDKPAGETFPNPISGYGNLNLEESFLSFFSG